MRVTKGVIACGIALIVAAVSSAAMVVYGEIGLRLIRARLEGEAADILPQLAQLNHIFSLAIVPLAVLTFVTTVIMLRSQMRASTVSVLSAMALFVADAFYIGLAISKILTAVSSGIAPLVVYAVVSLSAFAAVSGGLWFTILSAKRQQVRQT